MPLIVETGSGSATADSWIDLAWFAQYLERMGATVPNPDDDDASEIALRKACRAITVNWGYAFQGFPTNPEQRLPFPRVDCYVNDVMLASDSIPEVLKEAQAEFAIRILNGSDVIPDIKPTGYVTSEKLGPMQTDFAPPTTQFTSYTYIMRLIAPLLDSVNGSARLVRG